MNTPMKSIIVLAGAAGLALTTPAVADPGKGHGGGKHGYDRGYGYNGYGEGGCPHGLAKKHNGCRPPGQAKKLYRIGQRLPYGYNSYTPYNQIPYDVRNRYDLNPDGRYVYDQGYIYQVNPRTRIISQILNAILR